VFLTYSFDLPFFESYLLRFLVDGGASTVTVAADASWLAERLPSWIEAGEVREAGRSYTLHGVSVGGVFHPKLMLAASENSGAVFVGSGNISMHGMATGGELITLVKWDDEELPSLAKQAWRVCRQAAERLAVDPLFGRRVEDMAHLAPGLAVPPSGSGLLENLERPLIDQLINWIAARGVEKILAWSPFSDRRLDALSTLVRRLEPREVTLALQPGLTGIDGERLAAIATHNPLVSWHFLELRHSTPDTSIQAQLIHGKGILITLDNGADLLLAGSPNLSTPALLQTAEEATGNFEVALLTEGSELRERLFGNDGPIFLGGPVQPESVMWTHDPSVDSRRESAVTVELLGASWEGAMLTLYVRGTCPPMAEALINGVLALSVTFADGLVRVEVPSALDARSVQLVWEGGETGVVIISDLPRLAAMGRVRSSREHIPLEALDFGGDSDLLNLLEELARLAIISRSDVVRLMRGQSPPDERDEADEAQNGTASVSLEDIDFDSVRQHPRAQSYSSAGYDAFEAPRLQLYLDEVVQQFDALRERQLLRLVRPVPSDGDEAEVEEEDVEPAPEPRRWSVSRRVRLRVLHRMQRYVSGVSDSRFWRVVDPDWMAKNYVLFLDFLNRLWLRASDPITAILSSQDCSQLTLDLLAAFWGSDEVEGYWGHLKDDERLNIAICLEERRSIWLTAAMSVRVLRMHGDIGFRAPFYVRGFVRAADALGFLNEEAAEGALIYLDDPGGDSEAVLARLRAAERHFSWDRYVYLLARRFNLKNANLEDRGFTGGKALVIDAGQPIDRYPSPLAILADWIETTRAHDPRRRIFQMEWVPGKERVIYNSERRVLRVGHPMPRGDYRFAEISSSVRPGEFSEWAGIPGLKPVEGRAG
jgi:hypothetical protein